MKIVRKQTDFKTHKISEHILHQIQYTMANKHIKSC